MTTTTNRTDKVLVVDDDARIRDLLHRYLTQEGFDVMAAEDGKALNRLLLRERVDIIVLDLMMPGEDGLSICRRLRAANDRTPIIMLTAKGEDVDRIVGLEGGADDYLGKPFRSEDGLSICRRLRAANDRTPIIMLTAKGEDVDRIVGLEVGADDYLGKPFNPRELLARIHAVLRRPPAQEAPGTPPPHKHTAPLLTPLHPRRVPRAHPCGAAPRAGAGSAGRALRGQRGGHLRPLRLRPGHPRAAAQWRGTGPDDR